MEFCIICPYTNPSLCLCPYFSYASLKSLLFLHYPSASVSVTLYHHSLFPYLRAALEHDGMDASESVFTEHSNSTLLNVGTVQTFTCGIHIISLSGLIVLPQCYAGAIFPLLLFLWLRIYWQFHMFQIIGTQVAIFEFRYTRSQF